MAKISGGFCLIMFGKKETKEVRRKIAANLGESCSTVALVADGATKAAATANSIVYGALTVLFLSCEAFSIM